MATTLSSIRHQVFASSRPTRCVPKTVLLCGATTEAATSKRFQTPQRRRYASKHPPGFTPPTKEELDELRESVKDFCRMSLELFSVLSVCFILLASSSFASMPHLAALGIRKSILKRGNPKKIRIVLGHADVKAECIVVFYLNASCS